MRPPVKLVVAEGVATLEMNDGKVNVMTFEMLAAMSEAIENARWENAALVIRSGAAKAFSAGFDVKVLSSGDADAARRMLTAGARLLIQVLSHPQPVISVCEGHAYPMGAFLLLASDIRIGAQGDYRIGLNEVTIGIPVPDFALALVRSRVPSKHRIHIAALGRMLTPAAALEAGFLDQLVGASEIDATLSAVFEDIRSVNQAAHASTKRRLWRETIQLIEREIAGEILPQF